MTAYKQAYGEHYTHEVVPFAEVVLVRVPKPTHRGLQEGKRWHKGDAVFIKGVWVGKSDLSDEHIVLTPGGRVFSRMIRRLEPSRRHDAGFLDEVKGLPWVYGIGRLSSRVKPVSRTLFLVNRLRGRRCDSCQFLEMAALQLSRWRNWSKITGQMSMARERCLRDSIARWSQTWI